MVRILSGSNAGPTEQPTLSGRTKRNGIVFSNDYSVAHEDGPDYTANPWRASLLAALAIAGSGAVVGFLSGLACGWFIWG